jgi:peptidoglycan L-alanyl-D-glutamate endopeptidase CwlK
MIDSRDLAALNPIVMRKAVDFIAHCTEAGVEVLITSTYRDAECQAALYAIGRTQMGRDPLPVVRPMGRPVTWVGPGYSMHNWRCAFDFVPLRHGKPVWGDTGADLEIWTWCGELAESEGLEWGGRWPKPQRDLPHLQFTGGLTIAQLQAGGTIA